MKLRDLILVGKYDNQYIKESISSECLPDGYSLEDEIIPRGTTTRWRGTGYINSWYEHVKSGDAIIVKHNNGTVHFDDLFIDTWSISKGYYTNQREFGRRMSKLSKEYNIPFRIMCIFNGDVITILDILSQIRLFNKEYVTNDNIEDVIHELCGVGYDRRMRSITFILGENTPEGLGQKYSYALAEWIADNIYVSPIID